MLRFENNFIPVECCGPVMPLASLSAGAAGTLETLGAIASIGGTIFSAIGSMQQSSAEAASAEYNAAISERNAQIARQQTKADLEKQDRERRLRVGAAIARGGASGIGVESFGDIMQSSAAQEELDLLTIKSEGLLREQSYMQDASLSRMNAKSTKTAGMIGAGTELLTGIGGQLK